MAVTAVVMVATAVAFMAAAGRVEAGRVEAAGTAVAGRVAGGATAAAAIGGAGGGVTASALAGVGRPPAGSGSAVTDPASQSEAGRKSLPPITNGYGRLRAAACFGTVKNCRKGARHIRRNAWFHPGAPVFVRPIHRSHVSIGRFAPELASPAKKVLRFRYSPRGSEKPPEPTGGAACFAAD